MTKFKTEHVLSSHSFLSHQISVITLSDEEGRMYKGIAVSPIPIGLFSEATYSEAMGDYGKLLMIDTQQSKLLCTFIEDVLDGKLPGKILVNSNGPPLRIKLKKYIKNWHDGGAYKGSVVFGRSIGFGFISNAAVTKKSLTKLRKSIATLFDLDIKDDNKEE